MMATTMSDTMCLLITFVIMFASGYILGTTDEMGRENRRKEKRRRKREREDGKQ